MFPFYSIIVSNRILISIIVTCCRFGFIR